MAYQRKVKPSGLADAISDIIKEYGEEVAQAMPEAVKKVSTEAKKQLKERAKQSGIKGSGAYIKGFKKTTKQHKHHNGTVSGMSATLYNTQPHAHLLEFGHTIKNQTGKVYGVTRAFPHWKPVADEAGKELIKEIEDAVSKAGG